MTSSYRVKREPTGTTHICLLSIAMVSEDLSLFTTLVTLMPPFTMWMTVSVLGFL